MLNAPYKLMDAVMAINGDNSKIRREDFSFA